MKKYLLMSTFLLLMLSCQTQKVKSNVIYFLPSNVKEILYKEVHKEKKLNKEMFIVFKQDRNDSYIIYLNTDPNDSEKFWLQNSNRAIFLEKQLIIPFYFSLDQTFSYSEKGKNVLRKLGTEENLTKVISIRENTFHIKFKSNGEIIK